MRAVVQRVKKASVTVNQAVVGNIDKGLLVFLGVETEDNLDDVTWLTRKILGMRIFSDKEGKMNLSALDSKAAILIVSQFTLHASTKKGNRPSFVRSAKPDLAFSLYTSLIQKMKESELKINTGIFGEDMQVDLQNDGPVTILIDSKNKE